MHHIEMLAPDGGTAPAPQTYDLVLQAVGRTPNGKEIAADKSETLGANVVDCQHPCVKLAMVVEMRSSPMGGRCLL